MMIQRRLFPTNLAIGVLVALAALEGAIHWDAAVFLG
jgi:hypothetical protein